jgi:hypothetical protein
VGVTRSMIELDIQASGTSLGELVCGLLLGRLAQHRYVHPWLTAAMQNDGQVQGRRGKPYRLTC